MTDQALQLVSEEEGPSSAHVYPDSRGFWTIARGCLVDPRLISEGLCQAALDAQDAYSLDKAKGRAAALPGYENCSALRQAVLASMCYQLGDLSGWPHFRAALSAQDYSATADNMLYNDVTNHTRSDWDKQTSRRCEREAYMMRADTWLPHGLKVPAGK